MKHVRELIHLQLSDDRLNVLAQKIMLIIYNNNDNNNNNNNNNNNSKFIKRHNAVRRLQRHWWNT